MIDEAENFELEENDNPTISAFSETLDGLSEMDLLRVRALIGDELNARATAEKLKFIEDIQARAAAFGLAVRVIPFKIRMPKEVKYRNPDDSKQTWSGRGMAPKWFKEKLAEGIEKNDLLSVGEQ